MIIDKTYNYPITNRNITKIKEVFGDFSGSFIVLSGEQILKFGSKGNLKIECACNECESVYIQTIARLLNSPEMA